MRVVQEELILIVKSVHLVTTLIQMVDYLPVILLVLVLNMEILLITCVKLVMKNVLLVQDQQLLNVLHVSMAITQITQPRTAAIHVITSVKHV